MHDISKVSKGWLGGALLATGLALASASAGAATYSVLSLGIPAGNASSGGYALDNQGRGIGYAISSTTFQTGALGFNLTTGTTTNLGYLPGYTTAAQPIGMNNLGQAVGVSNSSSSGHAALFSLTGQGNTDLDAQSPYASYATAINDSGLIVGAATNAAGNTVATVFRPGSSSLNLGTLAGGGANSVAYGVNASGQIVGIAETSPDNYHATFFNTATGVNVDLGALGGDYSVATALNDNGLAVGSAYDAQFNSRAVVYNLAGGELLDLGTLGGTQSSAYDINNAGQVVGVSTLASGRNVAFIWQAGVGMQSLQSLIDPALGLTLSSANGINDLGQIIGTACIGSSQCRAVVLTPVPEPAPAALLAGGLALLMGGRRCAARRRTQQA